jgi:L-alanine-DL-glutamate epimerase-like enolase superfamily enzyme
LVGRDIDDVEDINRLMDVIANNNCAKGAIDICLHEALAASQGKSLLEFFDPPNRKVKVSYILSISDRNTMLAEAKSVYDRGVRVFKVKVGRDFSGDLNRIRALQAEFEGSNLWLYADANEAFQPDQAQTQLGQLAALGILYVEEPLPIELVLERANLRQAELVPLIADDSAFTYRDLAREIRFNTFDILNIKTARTGYFHSRRMLAAVKKYHKGVMVGSQASSTLGTLRAAIFAGLDGIDHPCELSFFLKLQDEIVNHSIKITDGYIDLDSLAAISLDEQRLKRFT